MPFHLPHLLQVQQALTATLSPNLFCIYSKIWSGPHDYHIYHKSHNYHIYHKYPDALTPGRTCPQI